MSRVIAVAVTCAIACSTSSSSPTPTPDAAPADAGSDAVADVVGKPIVDAARLGPTCSEAQPCTTGIEDCYDFHAVDAMQVQLRCFDGDPCSIVTCPAPKRCIVEASTFGKIYCANE